jgi:hypothetical protein
MGYDPQKRREKYLKYKELGSLTMNKEKRREWYEANRGKLNAQKRARHALDREQILKQKRQKYLDNRDKNLLAAKVYRDKNRSKIAAYERARRKTDPLFRVAKNLRSRVHQALVGLSKSASTLDLLGCTPEQAKAHIEGLFKPGMGWDNYGYWGWHIDHIIPIAAFDLSDPEQQRRAFCYTNLQPLWRRENQLKGSRRGAG